MFIIYFFILRITIYILNNLRAKTQLLDKLFSK